MARALTCSASKSPQQEFSQHFFGLLSQKGNLRGDQFDNQLAPVVQRLDNAIHRINHYPADSVVCFVNTYPLDSDLSGG